MVIRSVRAARLEEKFFEIDFFVAKTHEKLHPKSTQRASLTVSSKLIWIGGIDNRDSQETQLNTAARCPMKGEWSVAERKNIHGISL